MTGAVRSESTEESEPGVIGDARARLLACWLLLVATILGTYLRTESLERWPIPYHTMRQYMAALRARAVWLWSRSEPYSEMEQRWLETRRIEIYEPPLTEVLAAAAYRIVGREDPSLSVYLGTLFWLGSASFLFAIARRLTRRPDAAALVTSYYLLNPLGIILSRTFQPEPLMALGFFAAVWWILRRPREGTFRDGLLLGAIGGVSLLLKPGFLLFPLAGVYVGYFASHQGLIRALFRANHWLALLLFALPSFLYIQTVCRHQVSQTFQPQLLLSEAFYLGWFHNATAAVALPTLFLAGAGVFLFSLLRLAWVGPGLAVGYLLFSLSVPWHTQTHDYYQATLVIVVSLLLIPVSGALFQSIRWRELPLVSLLGTAALMTFGLTLLALPARGVTTSGGRRDAAELLQIGRSLGRDAVAIALDDEYGQALSFHGWLGTIYWPTRFDKLAEKNRTGKVEPDSDRIERFRKAGASHFVVLNREEAKGQPELLPYLERHFKQVVATPRILVFDLTKTASTGDR